MNKLELELDEKKVLADGEYNLDELYGYIDCMPLALYSFPSALS